MMILRSKKYTFILGLALFLVGLSLFAYLGIYNRYWADDWCYNADLKELGFWGTLKGYWYITTYAANRFSLTLFSGVLNSFGVAGVQLMTPLVIVLWFMGLYWILENVRALLPAHSFTPLHSLIVSAGITSYSIFLMPHMYQSLYWRSALLPYTAPIVFGVWVFALITFQARRPQPSHWLTALIGVLSFLAGGFSEAGCATLISILAVYVVACYLNRSRQWAKISMPVAVIALLSAILAMVLLVISPTVLHRLGLYDESSLPVLELLSRLLSNTFDFIKYSFLDTPFPVIAFLLTFGLIGFLSNSLDGRRMENKTLVWSLLLIGFLTFVFVAASYAPSTLIEKAPPATRTRVISVFILMLGLGSFASLSGYFLKQIFTWKGFEVIALILLCVTYFYNIRMIVTTTDRVSIYSERADVWDERDLQIVDAKAQGMHDVYVRAIDGRPVGGIRDFDVGPHGGFWINQCAARFYGVDAIYIGP